MNARQHTLALLKEGKTPGEISVIRGVTLNTTLPYLDEMVGKGLIRRSDILLSIPSERRLNPSDSDERRVVEAYGKAENLLGDIYEDVRCIEVALHELIRQVFEGEYGPGEMGWWRKGIPLPIRQSCQARREEDEDPVDAYNYTNLIDLRQIFDKQWKILKDTLPPELSSNKNRLKTDLLRLNQIRRMVMHPVRGTIPTEDDFDFLRNFRRQVESLSHIA